jgi:hypothetical protein
LAAIPAVAFVAVTALGAAVLSAVVNDLARNIPRAARW